jgi:hypothetical protein
MAILDDIKAEVTAMTDATQAAIALIQSLAAKLAAAVAANDPVALQEISDQLTKDAADLGAAITANTQP